MATQTEQAGLESRPGTQPLSDADKDTIRKGEFDESIIPAFVHNDPRGCCNLLSEGSWIKRLIHYQLINAILGSLTEGDYLYPQAKRVQGDIAAAMTAYEDLSDEQKADAEAAVQATQLWVEQARKKREQEQAAREENALVALGDVDSSAPPEKGPPRESDFETKKLRAHLAHVKVDLSALDEKWPAPFQQREVGLSDCRALVASFQVYGIQRAARSTCLYISLSKQDFQRHVQYTINEAVRFGKISDTAEARDALARSLTNPEKDTEHNHVSQYSELALLLFDPAVKQAILEAGRHRKTALRLDMENKLTIEQQQKIMHWVATYDPAQQQQRDLVEEYRSWGVIILDADQLRDDLPFLTILRNNRIDAVKWSSEGDWYRNFRDLWSSFSVQQRKSYTNKDRFQKKLCVELLGMHPSENSPTFQHLRTIAHNVGLHDALGDWVSFLCNRTVFRIYLFADVSGCKMPAFVSAVLQIKLQPMFTIFGANNRDFVTSLDIALINKCVKFVPTNEGSKVPEYQADELLDLFYPDSPDSVTHCFVGELKSLTQTALDELKRDETSALQPNVALRGHRRHRRPGFLAHLNEWWYDQAFRSLSSNQFKQKTLPDHEWITLFAKYHMPLLARAMAVVIWLFDPNHQYPWNTAAEYKVQDLEDKLFTVLGWHFNAQDHSYENMRQEGYAEAQEALAVQRKDVVRDFVTRAYNAIRMILSSKANGSSTRIAEIAKEWLRQKARSTGNVKMFDLTPTSMWIGDITVKDQELICRAIRKSPYISAVLKEVERLLPTQQAVGLGACIVKAMKPGSGIDFFGEYQKTATWQPIHQQTTSMYNTSHRTPKPLLPGDEGKNLGEKVGHGGELLFICFELEAYVARLELTNRNATVYKRDDGRLEKVYPESEAQGCTDEAQHRSLLGYMAHHILLIEESTGIVFPNVDYDALKGIKRSKNADGQDITEETEKNTDGLAQLTAADITDLPSNRLGLKPGYKFANAVTVTALPELQWYEPPVGHDDAEVVSYKEGHIKRETDEAKKTKKTETEGPSVHASTPAKRRRKEDAQSTSDRLHKKVRTSVLGPSAAVSAPIPFSLSQRSLQAPDTPQTANGPLITETGPLDGQYGDVEGTPTGPAPPPNPDSFASDGDRVHPDHIRPTDVPRPDAVPTGEDLINFLLQDLQIGARNATANASYTVSNKSARATITKREQATRTKLINETCARIGATPDARVFDALKFIPPTRKAQNEGRKDKDTPKQDKKNGRKSLSTKKVTRSDAGSDSGFEPENDPSDSDGNFTEPSIEEEDEFTG